MPLILALETATKLCSVAVGRAGEVLALREVDDAQLRHAERLNVLVDEVMREAGLSLREIDAVAVGTGPGSYTGLRIGLSVAKGFCYDCPVKKQCFQYALRTNQRHGIWGGTSPEER